MKPVSVYKVTAEPVKKEDHYKISIKAGNINGEIVMERSSIRHIIEILDIAIGTGIDRDEQHEQD